MFTESQINTFNTTPTPFYYYNLEVLKETLQIVKEESDRYGYMVHYAMKANTNNKILDVINTYGLGADCVSGNEIKKAVECNFSADHIVFAGVGKNDAEINYALDQNIFCFNCESIQELEVINELAAAKNKTANVALRINPNVNANTHKYITTGLEENKFGINLWELDAVLATLTECKNLTLTGLHFHIGSQITDLTAFKALCTKVNEIQAWFVSHQITIENLNVGGGLGVNYHEPDTERVADFASYFKLFDDFLELLPNQKVHFELGRSITAQCGALISKALYIKKGVKTNFVILDAGMTELLRPALYQAYHEIENLSRGAAKNSDSVHKYDVVGPICESSDCFGKAVNLPESFRGDLFAIRSTGSYGEVMSSEYNLRDKAKAIYSDEIE